MLKQWQRAALAKVLLGNEQPQAWGELKKIVLATLGAWIAYFLVINMFVRVLNKIVIPVLDLPLGFYLAIQGTVIVFGVVLYVLARRNDGAPSS
jgi:putative solute:sodium symporter small subunit